MLLIEIWNAYHTAAGASARRKATQADRRHATANPVVNGVSLTSRTTLDISTMPDDAITNLVLQVRVGNVGWSLSRTMRTDRTPQEFETYAARALQARAAQRAAAASATSETAPASPSADPAAAPAAATAAAGVRGPRERARRAAQIDTPGANADEDNDQTVPEGVPEHIWAPDGDDIPHPLMARAAATEATAAFTETPAALRKIAAGLLLSALDRVASQGAATETEAIGPADITAVPDSPRGPARAEPFGTRNIESADITDALDGTPVADAAADAAGADTDAETQAEDAPDAFHGKSTLNVLGDVATEADVDGSGAAAKARIDLLMSGMTAKAMRVRLVELGVTAAVINNMKNDKFALATEIVHIENGA